MKNLYINPHFYEIYKLSRLLAAISGGTRDQLLKNFHAKKNWVVSSQIGAQKSHQLTGHNSSSLLDFSSLHTLTCKMQMHGGQRGWHLPQMTGFTYLIKVRIKS